MRLWLDLATHGFRFVKSMTANFCGSVIEQEVETVQILADALPKIVPYVLINHREVSFIVLSPYTDNFVFVHNKL